MYPTMLHVKIKTALFFFCKVAFNYIKLFSVRDEDMQLLDILQQLEEDSNNEKIDLDSSLAPLSQNQNKCRHFFTLFVVTTPKYMQYYFHRCVIARSFR